MRFSSLILAATAAISPALGSVPAQDAAYLVATPPTAAPGEPVAMHVERGEAGASLRVAWPSDRAEWMFLNAGGNGENRHGVQPDEPDGDTVATKAPQEGVLVAGLDLSPVVESVSAASFAAFRRAHLPADSAGAAPAAPAGQVRIRRIESLAAIVRAAPLGQEPSPSAIATSKTGQNVSIRPLMDPTGLRAGGDVPFRLLAGGRGVAEGRLAATSLASGRVQSVTADSSGICTLHIAEVGHWRLEFHHLTRSADDLADWNLHTATLTFEVTRPAKEAP
jgi:hypothetical protein